MEKIHHKPHLFYTQLIPIQANVDKLKEAIKKQGTPLVIKGIGGSGKTSLCQLFYKKAEPNYEHLIWITVHGGNFDCFFSEVSLLEKFNIPLFSNYENKARKRKIIVKAFKKQKGRKLLIIDALDTEIKRHEAIFLKQLQQEAECTVIISSRYYLDGFSKFKMPTFSLENIHQLYEMYNSDGTEISENNYPNNYINNNKSYDFEITELYRYLDYHPFLIEISAVLLEKDVAIDAKDLLQELKNGNIQYLDTGIFCNKGGSVCSFLEHLQNLYNVKQLSILELKVLKEICCLTDNIISYDLCLILLKNDKLTKEKLEKVIKSLVTSSWIIGRKKSLKIPRVVELVTKYELLHLDFDYQNIYNNLVEEINNHIKQNVIELKKYIPCIKKLTFFLKSKNDKVKFVRLSNYLSIIYQELCEFELSLFYINEVVITLKDQTNNEYVKLQILIKRRIYCEKQLKQKSIPLESQKTSFVDKFKQVFQFFLPLKDDV